MVKVTNPSVGCGTTDIPTVDFGYPWAYADGNPDPWDLVLPDDWTSTRQGVPVSWWLPLVWVSCWCAGGCQA